MASEFEIERHCAFNKKPGIVQISGMQLVWTPDSAADGSELRISFTSIKRYQVSKEGAAKKALIRIYCSDITDKIILDFAKNFGDRDSVRDMLAKLQGKSSEPAPQPSSIAPRKPVSPEELTRRQKLLARKEVRKLHHQLVKASAAVTDDDFWAAMRFRYKDSGEPRNRSAVGVDYDELDGDNGGCQQQGVPNDAFTTGNSASDPKASKWEGVPTAAQRHMVFMEQPSVWRAYTANVPGEMTAEKFWDHFLHSSMAGRRSGRMTKTDTARAAEGDAVFAPFQARENEVSEREATEKAKALARELALDRFDDHRTPHVLEGHAVTGEAPRSSKRARDSGAGATASSGLKLMKMMNKHGDLVLGDGKLGGWVGAAVDKVRPLEDLEPAEAPGYTKLGEGAKGSTGGDVQPASQTVTDLDGFCQSFEPWEGDIRKYEHPVAGSEEALHTLLAAMRQ